MNVLLRAYAKCVYGQDEASRKRIEAALLSALAETPVAWHLEPGEAEGPDPKLLGVYTLPLVAMEARICQLSPLRNDDNYVCARTAQPRRVPEPVPLIGTHSHSR